MKCFFLILLVITTTSASAQTDQITQWKQELNSEIQDTTKFSTCIDLHNALFVNDPPQSKFYAYKMLDLARRIPGNQQKYLAKAYTALARCERKARNYQKVLLYDRQVLQYAKKSGEKPGILSANLQLARDYLDADQPSNALPYLNRCTELCQETGDLSQTAKTSQTFAWYYFKTNQNKKAVPAYYEAIEAYSALQNAQMVAECKILLVESLLLLGKTGEVPNLLFGALDTYKKRNSLARQAYSHGLLGQCYLMNGSSEKGRENYFEAKRLYKVSNNKVEEALATIDIARSFLSENDEAECKKYLSEAEAILDEMEYPYGLVIVKTVWGQYHSQKANFTTAESYFLAADRMAVAHALPDLKAENEKYWAAHRYRQKDYKGGDSLLYSYAQQIATAKEPEVIANDLNMVFGKNTQLDANAAKVVSLLYTPGGVAALKKRLGHTELKDMAPIDSILLLNPFSRATAGYDSAKMMVFNHQLMRLETEYKTRQLADSFRIERQHLQIQKQNTTIAQEQLRTRNTILLASAVLLLLVSGALWMQYKHRKRTEKDKQKIELLQDEIHHRIKNNLAVIRRLVDVAGNSTSQAIPLFSLQSRIATMEMLHKHLYSDKTVTGKVHLQTYLEELVQLIQNTFEPDNPVSIHVKAALDIEIETAEKIGLIVNELVTNSFKYAFTGQTAGQIEITVQQLAGEYQLIVKDNGRGFNHSATNGSYGLKLIRGLSNELNGKYSFSSNGATTFHLKFTALTD